MNSDNHDFCRSLLEYLVESHKETQRVQDNLLNSQTSMMTRCFWLILIFALTGQIGMGVSNWVVNAQAEKLENVIIDNNRGLQQQRQRGFNE